MVDIDGGHDADRYRVTVSEEAGTTGHRAFTAVTRASLNAALLSRLATMPNVEVRTGHRVQRTIEEADFIWLEATDPSGREVYRYRAFWVLACDPLHGELAASTRMEAISGVPLPAYRPVTFSDGRIVQHRSVDASRPMRWTVGQRHGRVVRLASARRAASLCAGQDLNAAMRDAISICWRLSFGIPGLIPMQLLLDSYELERKAESRFRDVRLQAVEAQAPGATEALLAEPPPLPSSALSRPHHGGSMLPQARVSPMNGHLWSLDDLLGTGFSLVQLDDAPPLNAAQEQILAWLTPTMVRVGRAPELRVREPRAAWVWNQDQTLVELLESTGGLVIRPDRYIWGTIAELAEHSIG